MKINFSNLNYINKPETKNISSEKTIKGKACLPSFKGKATINYDVLYDLAPKLHFSFDETEQLKEESMTNRLSAVVLACLIKYDFIKFDSEKDNFKDMFQNNFKQTLINKGLSQFCANELEDYVKGGEVIYYNIFSQKIAPLISQDANINFQNKKINADEYIKIMQKTGTKIKDCDIELVKDFLAKGYDLFTIMSLIRKGLTKTKTDHKRILQEVESKDTKIMVQKLQNGRGYLVQTQKRGHDNEFNTDITIIKTFFKDKTVTQRIEKDEKESRACIQGLNSNIFLKTKHGAISDLFEFHYCPFDVEKSEIIRTTPSKNLQGAYEVSKFYLKDYPQNADIFSLIKKDPAHPGVWLSKTDKKDDSVEFEENYFYNNCEIKRKYFEQKDSKGEVIKSIYSYVINEKDKNGNYGNNLLNLNRSFEKISHNKTRTQINGIVYEAEFNDDKMGIVITNKTTGERTVTDIKEKLLLGIGCVDERYTPFFEFCKSLNADALFDIERSCDAINISHEACFENDTFRRLLQVYARKGVLYHETGHAMDNYLIYCFQDIADSELIDIYNKEMENFEKNNSAVMLKFIDYFSSFKGGGGGENDGLSEMIAEAYVLFNTYNHSFDEESLMTRAHLLVRYFPKTMSEIIKRFQKQEFSFRKSS